MIVPRGCSTAAGARGDPSAHTGRAIPSRRPGRRRDTSSDSSSSVRAADSGRGRSACGLIRRHLQKDSRPPTLPMALPRRPNGRFLLRADYAEKAEPRPVGRLWRRTGIRRHIGGILGRARLLSCPRCGRDTHLPLSCAVTRALDSNERRMTSSVMPLVARNVLTSGLSSRQSFVAKSRL